MNDDLYQKTHENMMFSVSPVKMVLLFPTNMKLHFFNLQINPKNTLKDGISGIT